MTSSTFLLSLFRKGGSSEVSRKAEKSALFYESSFETFSSKGKKGLKNTALKVHTPSRESDTERERRRRRRRTRDARPRIDDDGNTYNGHRRWRRRRRRRRTAPRRAFTGRLERCPRRDAAKILQRGEARRDRKVQDAPVRQR